jgi:hypothetical protein
MPGVKNSNTIIAPLTFPALIARSRSDCVVKMNVLRGCSDRDRTQERQRYLSNG